MNYDKIQEEQTKTPVKGFCLLFFYFKLGDDRVRDGFIKVAAITPEIKVADVDYNSEIICSYMKKAEQEGAKISVFPELCITGYTCSGLILAGQTSGVSKKWTP